MSTPNFRALLLDDDDYALDYLRALIEERYPTAEIETRRRPDPSGDYDVYFLDDDFEGVPLAAELARKIRHDHPEALILAFSAGLNPQTLSALLNAGCNGVCDKRVSSDLPEMMRSLDRCLGELGDDRDRRLEESKRLVDTFRDLFREWNRRLGSQE